MADQELRELERRWRGSGTWSDWLAWAKAAARAGDRSGVELDRSGRNAYVWSMRRGRIRAEVRRMAGYSASVSFSTTMLAQHRVLVEREQGAGPAARYDWLLALEGELGGREARALRIARRALRSLRARDLLPVQSGSPMPLGVRHVYVVERDDRQDRGLARHPMPAGSPGPIRPILSDVAIREWPRVARDRGHELGPSGLGCVRCRRLLGDPRLLGGRCPNPRTLTSAVEVLGVAADRFRMLSSGDLARAMSFDGFAPMTALVSESVRALESHFRSFASDYLQAEPDSPERAELREAFQGRLAAVRLEFGGGPTQQEVSALAERVSGELVRQSNAASATETARLLAGPGAQHEPAPFEGRSRCRRCGAIDLALSREGCPVGPGDRPHSLEVVAGQDPDGEPRAVLRCGICLGEEATDLLRPFRSGCPGSPTEQRRAELRLREQNRLRVPDGRPWRPGNRVTTRLIPHATDGFLAADQFLVHRQSGSGTIQHGAGIDPGAPAPDFWLVRHDDGAFAWYYGAELGRPESRRVCGDCENDVLDDGTCDCSVSRGGPGHG